jgi:hypothetical protein
VFSIASESSSECHCEEKWLGAGVLAGWFGRCDEMMLAMLHLVSLEQWCTA